MKDQYRGCDFGVKYKEVTFGSHSFIRNAVGLLFAQRTLEIREIIESMNDIKGSLNDEFIRKVKGIRRTIMLSKESSEFSFRKQTSEFIVRNNFSTYITPFQERNEAPVSVGSFARATLTRIVDGNRVIQWLNKWY